MPIVQGETISIHFQWYGVGMIKHNESVTAQTDQGKRDRSRVDILHSEVSQPEERTETIVFYGFVHNRAGQIAGFTLSCTVHWQVDDYSLDSGASHGRAYFSNLVENHADAPLFTSDAALEMTFTDPELNEPIGFGSGYLKIQGSLRN